MSILRTVVRRVGVVLLGLFIVEAIAVGRSVSAGDWPEILGPRRSGIADGETLSDRWPASGPRVLWKRKVGAGQAGVAVVGQKGVLFHRLDDEEFVEAFDVQSGKRLWSQSYPTDFQPQVGGDNGPLCVPTIASGRVITFGPQGVLTCWNLDTGKQAWQRNTHKDYDAHEGYFGAGSSPVVVGQKVIVNVGGRRDRAGVVAFALDNGQELWRAVEDGANYAAPRLITLDGQKLVLAVTRLKCVVLDPETGQERFEVPFGRMGANVTAATPVILDQHAFLTASYGIGALLIRMEPASASEVYRRGDVISSQYTTPIAHDDFLIGIDGRDDGPPAQLKCVDPLSGDTLWTKADYGYATLIEADDKLLLLTAGGELVLARPRRDRYEELSRFALTRQTTRALPALANGRLFVRDTDTLYCLDVSRGP